MKNNLYFWSILDILVPKPRVYVKSNKRFISLISIIVSLVCCLCAFSLILYFFIEFLMGSGMTMVYSKEEVFSDFSFNLTNKLFAFYLSELDNGAVDPRIATVIPVLWKNKNIENPIGPPKNKVVIVYSFIPFL